eukprot:TRINITY_DN35742_c0_g1_i5.p1 TRINITY_DN35742_c0_g1~~TRINITY_DN35742_c0_g1_i5.p1  ORF type:complete len:270 (-),score=77.63 TRINITY_DN35742_c0_g1_i5:47-856(-)
MMEVMQQQMQQMKNEVEQGGNASNGDSDTAGTSRGIVRDSGGGGGGGKGRKRKSATTDSSVAASSSSSVAAVPSKRSRNLPEQELALPAFVGGAGGGGEDDLFPCELNLFFFFFSFFLFLFNSFLFSLKLFLLQAMPIFYTDQDTPATFGSTGTQLNENLHLSRDLRLTDGDFQWVEIERDDAQWLLEFSYRHRPGYVLHVWIPHDYPAVPITSMTVVSHGQGGVAGYAQTIVAGCHNSLQSLLSKWKAAIDMQLQAGVGPAQPNLFAM